jgi:hypothetical protein
MSAKSLIFENFSEYWYFTRCLDKDQRDILFQGLPSDQQKKIKRSYQKGGWEDLFIRNQTDKTLDEIKREYNIDMLYIRTKVLSGKSYYIKRSQWEFIVDMFKGYDKKHTDYIFEGIYTEPASDDAILLTSMFETSE